MTIGDEDRERIHRSGRKAGSMLQIHEIFRKKPIISSTELTRTSTLSAPTVNAAVTALSDLGIIKEITGKKRDRIYVYDRYLSTLDRGVG